MQLLCMTLVILCLFIPEAKPKPTAPEQAQVELARAKREIDEVFALGEWAMARTAQRCR